MDRSVCAVHCRFDANGVGGMECVNIGWSRNIYQDGRCSLKQSPFWAGGEAFC